MDNRKKWLYIMENEKCLVQLDEMLKYLRLEDLKKIPLEIRKAINEKKDKQYKWDYDESKSLQEQNIDRKTIAMLSYLNMEYLLDEEQRKMMKEWHKFNEQKMEEEKVKKYKVENIFENRRAKFTSYEQVKDEGNAIVKHRQTIFTKIREILKNLF